MATAHDVETHQHLMQLKYRYCYLIDDGEYERWADLFVEDGVFKGGDGTTYRGFSELLQFASNVFDERFEYTAHTVTNGLIDVSDDTASGRWYVYTVRVERDGTPGFFQGRYEDKMRLVDDEWRFESVNVVKGVAQP